MIIRCILTLLFMGSVITSGNLNSYGLANDKFDTRLSYSYWPSMLNAAGMMKIRKRELGQVGPNEGGGAKGQPIVAASTPDLPVASKSVPSIPHQSVETTPTMKPNELPQTDKTKVQIIQEIPKANVTAHSNLTTIGTIVPIVNITKAETKNETETEVSDKVDLSGPGVVKRGVIVFGGFALLAAAYFLIYRRKGSNKDSNNKHNATDANQFRYGVLQSDDRRDNMELSRVPLTMESDDDEDDDLEIFDLEQKKKSLSYVNLQVNDEEVVRGPKDGSDSGDRDNLLLDIEDVNSEALINWSNSGNKSIL